MTTSESNVLILNNESSTDTEEYSIPIDIFDIISVCKEYNRLGFQIQNQIENILELGVNESIKNGFVKQQHLPHIKNFLKFIMKNPYFGDAVTQANDCIELIDQFNDSNKIIKVILAN